MTDERKKLTGGQVDAIKGAFAEMAYESQVGGADKLAAIRTAATVLTEAGFNVSWEDLANFVLYGDA